MRRIRRQRFEQRNITDEPATDHRSHTCRPGDSILLRRGDFLYEQIIPVNGEEGNWVRCAAYGDENLPEPVISDAALSEGLSFYYDRYDDPGPDGGYYHLGLYAEVVEGERSHIVLERNDWSTIAPEPQVVWRP